MRIVMTRRLAVGVLAVAPFAALAAAPASAAEIKVGIDNFTFNPKELKVKTGTTVVWTNNDDIPHTVASPRNSIKSKPLDTGDSFSFTFTTPGAYDYFCSLHPHMTGRIVVEAATGENDAK
ncbi:MAG TPA: cupredoxin family copper-binding protein [Pseudolabrys sp.]|nr:cupredoxin family copper-binding protein [Pseudolabrys sp.]